MKRYVLLVFLLVLCPVFLAGSAERKKDDPWVSMTERVRIWDEVVAKELNLSLPLREPRPYIVSSKGLEATFEKDGTKWTIIGANAPIVNPTVYPKNWPVNGSDFEVLVIPEPITNYKILPFTENIENAIKSDTISITAATDSYEPASFVIRSGDVDLKDVVIKVSDLKAKVKDQNGHIKTAVIPKENIDIRMVKCWYQAGVAINDVNHKMLTPELLLHDDEFVKVDYDRQVNILKNLEKIRDAEKNKSFVIPKKQNKQVWLTADVTKEFAAGNYRGTIKIASKNRIKELKVDLEVLPFELPDPMLEYTFYYEGRLSETPSPRVYKNFKTAQQMLHELIDMKQHGLTNATVWHVMSENKSNWDAELKELQQTLELRQRMGWGKKPLLYLDWKTRFKEDFIGKGKEKKKIERSDIDTYVEKVKKVIQVAQNFGINTVYVYGVDERRGKDLLDLRPYYKAVRAAGGKNFVACKEDFLLFIPDLLDLPVIYGRPTGYYMKILRIIGVEPWTYSSPSSGMEEAERYRRSYGIGLYQNGFSGACVYTYHQGWNDFKNYKYRSGSMVYPTIDRPISTLQWEGWREGVNDIRYITLMKQKKILRDGWIEDNCAGSANDCRGEIVKAILSYADYTQI